jgi:signal transduction histidine kinase/CheY-like chemotaxis protein
VDGSGPEVVGSPDWRALFEGAPGLYLALTPDLHIVAASQAYLDATMTRREQILTRSLFDVFPDNPGDPQATGVANLRASLARVLAGRRPDVMAVQKYDISRPDGTGFEERFWSPVNTPVLAADGQVAYILHRVEDVTEFVRLSRLERDHEQRTSELQSKAWRMEAEVLLRSQELQTANRELRQLQEQLEDRVRERTAELERALGALRHSEAQLRQAQKLEAVGRLAGGVAHDFNNLLTVILGYGALLRERLAGQDGLQRDLDEVIQAGERAARLTRQLLAFSRQQVLEPRVLDLNSELAHLDRMLRRLIGEDIDLVTAATEHLWCVKADPGQIEQVVLNLVVNARDAMPAGGKLTIETANTTIDAAGARANLQPGDYVMLAVSDTGTGISPAVRSRLFEPFFTTKEVGRGTGLGLSTIHGIVVQSGGHIEVYSEEGRGTTFKIYLPRVHDPLEVAPEPATAPQAMAPAHATILVAEDDDAIRRVVREALEQRGYTVLEAGDGSEGLAQLQPGRPPVDLLITDVVMPRMGGADLVAEVERQRPDLPVLFVSGYTDRALVHQGWRRPGTAFLQKPFTLEALAAKVRQVLDAAAR